MHRQVISLIATFAAAAALPAHSKELPPMIELHARCVDDAQCRFRGDTVNVELDLDISKDELVCALYGKIVEWTTQLRMLAFFLTI